MEKKKGTKGNERIDWRRKSSRIRNLCTVMVFVDQDLGTGVNKKRDTGDPNLEWNKGALFAVTHVYILSYKAALGSKNWAKTKPSK